MPQRISSNGNSERGFNRREWLGVLGAGGAITLAGCIGGDDDDDNGDDDDEEGEDLRELTAVDDAPLDELVEGGSFVWGAGANIDSFDGPYSTDTTSTLAQSFIYESLTTSDSEGNLYPWLAEDWDVTDVQDVSALDYEDYMQTFEAGEEGAVDHGEQEIIRHPEDAAPEEGDDVRVLLFDDAGEAVEDGVYGVHIRYDLREGVQFHNGEEMTAEDVVASYDRLKLSDNAAQYFDSILYYEAVDEYTVDVYAQEADAEAERELPPMYVYPKEQAELPPGDLDPRQGNEPIGTGPYEFVEMEDEQWADYEKFDNYWLEEMGVDSLDYFDGPEEFPDGPVIDEITVEIIPDPPTRSASLQDGELDATTGLEASTLGDFDTDDEFTVTAVETGGYDYLQPPIQVEPWDDQRLRQAFNKLVPRELIVENIFDGWARPAFTMLPELAQGLGTQDADALEEDVRHYNEYDPEEATEMIEEVFDDYDIEAPLEVQLETNVDNDDRVAMVELIAESMEETGMFDTNVETYEWTTYTARVLDTEYAQEGHIACIGLSGTFNPESFCNALHHSSNHGACCNLSGVNNPEIDEMMDNARYDIEAVEDPDVRRDRYDEIYRELEEYAASAIVQFGTQESVLHENVKNWGQWPFHEGSVMYALHSPVDERVLWKDE